MERQFGRQLGACQIERGVARSFNRGFVPRREKVIGRLAGRGVCFSGVDRTSSVMTTSSGYLYGVNKCVESHVCSVDILLGVSCGPALQFLLVFVGGIGCIFHLCVFTGESSATAVGLEELCGGFIASGFHRA